MFRPGGGTEVGYAAHVPQKLHALWFGQPVPHLGQGGQGFQGQHVIGIAGTGQPVVLGMLFQAADQAVG